MKRLLLLLPSKTYRASAFVSASDRLNSDVVIGVDESQASAEFSDGHILQCNFMDPLAGARDIAAFAAQKPFDAIVAAEEDAVLLAAHVARLLKLRYNSTDSVSITRDKYLFRKTLDAAGFLQPTFKLLRHKKDLDTISQTMLPCVIKPTGLSASCGVIRADTLSEAKNAYLRVSKILSNLQMDTSGILLEDYIPGEEMAFDGVLENRRLHTLAFFDKPNPLTGPFFPETIYLTPSQKSEKDLLYIKQTIASAAAAIGLSNGPIHAELRIRSGNLYVLEIAARSIGGRCGKSLRFTGGYTLEDVILRQAMGEFPISYQREQGAAGVMMIQVPCTGVLKKVEGLSSARTVPCIDSVEVTVPIGQRVVSLPEGRQYLGFIFARAAQPRLVEAALRNAFKKLRIVVEAVYGSASTPLTKKRWDPI